MSHLLHDGRLPPEDVRRGVFATEFQWIGKGCGDKSAIWACQGDCGPSEVLLRYSFGPIDAVTHFDGVEIDFHDAFLAPDELNQDGKVGFQALTNPAGIWPEKDVLGCLLADGAAASVAFAGASFLHRLVDFDEVEAVVGEETLVLACHNGDRHVDAHRVERYPMMLEAQLFAPMYLLGTTDYHKWRDIDGTPLIYKNCED